MESRHLSARAFRMIEKEKFSPKLRSEAFPMLFEARAHLHTSCFSCLMFGADECLRKVFYNGLVITPQNPTAPRQSARQHQGTDFNSNERMSEFTVFARMHKFLLISSISIMHAARPPVTHSHARTPPRVCPTRPPVEKKTKHTLPREVSTPSPPRSAISSGLHSAENKVFVLF